MSPTLILARAVDQDVPQWQVMELDRMGTSAVVQDATVNVEGDKNGVSACHLSHEQVECPSVAPSSGVNGLANLSLALQRIQRFAATSLLIWRESLC
jgi:hypothetical protein